MYSLFCRYVYVLELTAALLPRMALPCKDIRDGVPERDTTLRAVDVERDAFATVPRDTTLRPAVAVPRDVVAVVAVVPRDAVTLGRDVVAVVPRDAVVVARDAVGVTVARDTVPRDAVPRDVIARGDVATVVAVAVPRDTVFVALRRDVVAVLRGDAVPARVAWGPMAATDVVIGAIGSANTERIDTNVEHTKNAPASKNTVPMAFLQKSAKLRLFIKLSLYSGKARKTQHLTATQPCQ